MLKVSKILSDKVRVAIAPPPAQTTQNKVTDPNLRAPQHIQVSQEKSKGITLSATGDNVSDAVVKLIYKYLGITDHFTIRLIYSCIINMHKLPNSGITLTDASNGSPAFAAISPVALPKLRTLIQMQTDKLALLQRAPNMDAAQDNLSKWLDVNPGGGSESTSITAVGQVHQEGHLNHPSN